MSGIGIVEAVVIAERERIIKLLEDYDWFENDSFEDKEILIALIKGENK